MGVTHITQRKSDQLSLKKAGTGAAGGRQDWQEPESKDGWDHSPWLSDSHSCLCILACQPNYFRAPFSLSLEPKQPAAPGYMSSQPGHQRESSNYKKGILSSHVPIPVAQGNHLVRKGERVDPPNIRGSVPRSKRAECWADRQPWCSHLLSKRSLNTYYVPTPVFNTTDTEVARTSMALLSWR